MRQFLTGRRLALLGIVLASQLLTACCLPPRWGGMRGGGHYADGPGGRGDQQAPAPQREYRRP